LSATTTTIATRGTVDSAHPLPTTTTHQREITPLYDRCPTIAGIYYASTITREPS